MSNKVFDIAFDDTEFKAKILELSIKSPLALTKAMEIGGLQMLTWMNNGSSRSSRKPPLKKGFLRGSSSVFLGGSLVGVLEGQDNRYVNRTYAGKPWELVWGWNAAYATRMHESEYKPGPISTQDGDAGNKWAEQHLVADGDALYELIAHEWGKGMGTL